MARISPPTKEPWTAKLLNVFLSRRYGKPFPALRLLGHHPQYPFAYGVFSSIFGLSKTKLPLETKRLATQLVAELNGCNFCIDLGKRIAQDEKLGLEKMQHVLEFETYALFTPSERAALRYAFEATQVMARVSDTTFSELEKHFSEREILELTVAVATENFYNRLNAPLEVESQGFCTLSVNAAAQRQTI
jgi:AhpD family alkylhydroperoxidase